MVDVVGGSTWAVLVAFVVLEGFLVVCLVVLVKVENADFVLFFNCLRINDSLLLLGFYSNFLTLSIVYFVLSVST